MRKSITTRYFYSTAFLLVCGVALMWFIQMYLAMGYFRTENDDNLLATVDTVSYTHLLCDGVSGIACRPAAGLRQRPAPHKVCRHGGKVAVACAAAVYRCDRHGRSEKEMLPVQAVTALCAQREKHARGLVARTQRLAHAARIEGVAHLRSRQAKKKLGLHLVYKKIVHIVQWLSLIHI